MKKALDALAYFLATASIAGAVAKTSRTSPGRLLISSMSPRASWRDKRRVRPNLRAIISNATTWQVKALVEATPISGPAWR